MYFPTAVIREFQLFSHLFWGVKMRNIKRSKTFAMFLTTFFACSVLSAPGANAAYTVLPKVGQCFQYTKAQVSASYAPKNPISCSSTHNMETFAVAKWPLSTNPADMEDEDKMSIVSEYCDFWGTFPNAEFSRSSKTNFNYWAWYTPSRTAWAKGQRWIRCDAMIGVFKTADSWPPEAHISWKGVKLNKIY